MKVDDTYITKDLAEASYLYTEGSKLLDLKNQDGRFWFVFADKSTSEQLADSFWRREAVVNARDFYNSFRTLKDFIFNKGTK